MIATEVSEALKAVRYVKPGGDFVLYGSVGADGGDARQSPLPCAGARCRDAGALARRAASCTTSSPRACRFQDAPVPDNIFCWPWRWSRPAGPIVAARGDVAAGGARPAGRRGIERNSSPSRQA